MGFEGIQKAGIDGCAGILAVFLAVGIFAFATLMIYLLSEGFYTYRDKFQFVLAICILLIAGLSQPGTGFPVCYAMFLGGTRGVSSTDSC